MERRIATRGIIFEHDTVFAVKHKDKAGNEVDFWAIPGGGLDPLESLHDNLTREFTEELGIKPTIGKLLFTQQYRDDKREYLEFFFHIKNSADYHKVNLSTTSHGALELSRCEFIDPRAERILPEFLQTVDIAAFINEQHSPAHYTYLSDHA